MERRQKHPSQRDNVLEDNQFNKSPSASRTAVYWDCTGTQCPVVFDVALLLTCWRMNINPALWHMRIWKVFYYLQSSYDKYIYDNTMKVSVREVACSSKLMIITKISSLLEFHSSGGQKLNSKRMPEFSCKRLNKTVLNMYCIVLVSKPSTPQNALKDRINKLQERISTTYHRSHLCFVVFFSSPPPSTSDCVKQDTVHCSVLPQYVEGNYFL